MLKSGNNGQGRTEVRFLKVIFGNLFNNKNYLDVLVRRSILKIFMEQAIISR